jgi:sec-independent protein translocase protein TatC
VLRWVRNDISHPSLLPFSANVTLIAGTLTAPLELLLWASLILGFAVSSPVIAYEVYRFIDPALYENEKKAVYPFLASFTTLFVIGIIFGYKILTPLIIWGTLLFFPSVQAAPEIFVNNFYQIIFLTTLASGFSFTLPVFFVLLVKFGILSTGVVTHNRKYIYVALYIIAAFLTPDGTIVGDLILFIPLVILLEIGVLFAKRYEKAKVETSKEQAKLSA